MGGKNKLITAKTVQSDLPPRRGCPAEPDAADSTGALNEYMHFCFRSAFFADRCRNFTYISFSLPALWVFHKNAVCVHCKLPAIRLFCPLIADKAPCGMVILHRQVFKNLLNSVKTEKIHKSAYFYTKLLAQRKIIRYNVVSSKETSTE